MFLISRESFCEITRMPNLGNMVRQRLTFLLRQSVAYHDRFQGNGVATRGRMNSPTAAELLSLALPACRLIQIRYFRTARRWWLLYILWQNPSLRPLRKHRLALENEIIGAVTESSQQQPYQLPRRSVVSEAEMGQKPKDGEELSAKLLQGN